MTPYRYTFFRGKPFIDLTKDIKDDEGFDTTAAEVEQPKSCPTPSQSPEASSSQPQTTATPNGIINPLPRSQSIESSSRAIDRSIKIKVAMALLVEGKQNLNREKLCQEVSVLLVFQFIADLIDWSL